MPPWLPDPANLVANLVGLVVVLLAVTGLFRDRQRGQTIATLTESNEALKEQNALLKEDKATSKALLDATVAQNAVLRDALSAKIDVAAIVDAITHHHVAMTDEWRVFGDQFREAMLQMGNRLDRNHDRIGDLLNLTGDKRHPGTHERTHP